MCSHVRARHYIPFDIDCANTSDIDNRGKVSTDSMSEPVQVVKITFYYVRLCCFVNVLDQPKNIEPHTHTNRRVDAVKRQINSLLTFI